MVAPLIQQSGSRLKNLASTIRRQQFTTKTELGPQITQAIAEAGLEQERLERQATARISLQAGVERERIEVGRERISEAQRQFDVSERREKKQEQSARKRRRAKGATSGASTGAAIGTQIYPGVGTVVGGVIGAVVGAVGGGK